MRGKAEAEAENVRDIFFRERSAMALRESREVGGRFPKGLRDGSVASAIRAVTCRAVFLVNLLARRDIVAVDGGARLRIDPEMRGSMSRRSVPNRSAFDRANYIRVLSSYALNPRRSAAEAALSKQNHGAQSECQDSQVRYGSRLVNLCVVVTPVAQECFSPAAGTTCR